MLIALIGLPNKGKSTLFNALTLGNAAVANYPFTTIDPNKGVAFASSECPHLKIKKECNPNNSKCVLGIRRIPINVLDVAGLVEGAHEGKGMGNQFLADVATADCVVLVADASGGTDDAGNVCPTGTHDPLADISLIESELDFWYADVLRRNSQKAKMRKLADLAELLSGLKITYDDLNHAVMELELNEAHWEWSREQLMDVAKIVRQRTKPIVIAANKIDSEHAEGNVEKLKSEFPNYKIFPVSADTELALRKAQERGLIRYEGRDFQVVQEGLSDPIKNALLKFQTNVIHKYGSTGVQDLINYCAFDLLDQIVVYPVEDEVHFCNHFGKVLPDAVLLRKGSKAVDLAAKIHSDLAQHLLYAIDAEKKMRISKDSELHHNQIVKIVSAK